MNPTTMKPYTLTWQPLAGGILTAATGRRDATHATITPDDFHWHWNLTDDDGDPVAEGWARTSTEAGDAVQAWLADHPVTCVRCGDRITPLPPFGENTWENSTGLTICTDWTGHDAHGTYGPSHTDDPELADLDDADSYFVHFDGEPCLRCTFTVVLAELTTAVHNDDLPQILVALRKGLAAAAFTS